MPPPPPPLQIAAALHRSKLLRDFPSSGGTPLPFEALAWDALTARADAARKEEEAADAGLLKLERKLGATSAAADDSRESVAAALRAKRPALESRKSAAAAQVRAWAPALARLKGRKFPPGGAPGAEAEAGVTALADFPTRVEYTLEALLPFLERAALRNLRKVARHDWEGSPTFRSLAAEGRTPIAAELVSLLHSALNIQGKLWNDVGDSSVASAELSARTSVISAASARVLSALVGWRSAAADLLSASSINGLGELVGMEALGCTRRKVSRRLLYPIATPLYSPPHRLTRGAIGRHHRASRLLLRSSHPRFLRPPLTSHSVSYAASPVRVATAAAGGRQQARRREGCRR